jgi:hypothetical protein
MSGHKHATVRAKAGNLRELSQAERSQRFVKSKLEKVTRRLEKQAQLEREQTLQHLQAANQELVENLSFFDEEIGLFESQVGEALVEQQQYFSEALQQVTGELNEEHDQNLAIIQENYELALEEMESRFQETYKPVTDVLRGMMDTQADQMAYYERWSATVQAMVESLLRQPEMDRIYPDLQASYQESVALAEQNVQAGMIETAVGELQRTYHELSLRLTRYRSFAGQYDELRRTAKLKLAKLEQEILHNQQVPGMDLEGRVLPYTIEVNTWVGGDFARLFQEVQRGLQQIEAPVSQGQMNRLREMITQRIPAWQAQAGELVYQARMAVINSQLRVNIASLAMKALKTQGYQIEQAGYEEEDMRGMYRVQMVDIEGSRIVIKVEPKAGAVADTELHVYANDQAKRTPHEMRQRAREIERSLSGAGLMVGELTQEEPRTQHRRAIRESADQNRKPVYQTKVKYER